MGKRNRERRAAKKRARQQHASSRPPGQRPTDTDEEPPTPELLAQSLIAAARSTARGDSGAATECVRAWSGGRFVGAERTVDTAVTVALRQLVGQLWAHGWLPEDVHQVVRRRASELAVALADDAIADEAAQYPVATTHPRWLAQVASERWWTPSRPHFTQWLTRHELDRGQGLERAIELLALFLTMPILPTILPPPGTAHAGTRSTVGVDEKVLGRVRRLLAKAESTPYAEEAEALSAKAQELMSRHAIERATVEAEQRAPQIAAARRLWLDHPYLSAKATLVAQVASANRCRTVSYEKLGFTTVLGDEADLEMVELLSTSLLLQATRAMLATGSQITRSGQSRTRSFRHSFLISYAHRIGERLRETAQHSVDSAGTAVVPVFAERERAVDELFDSLFAGAVTARRTSAGNAAGWWAGREAADRAVLDTERTAVEA